MKIQTNSKENYFRKEKMDNMSEDEALDIINNVICDEVISTYCIEIQKEINCSKNCENEDCYLIQAIETLLDLYKQEKENNKFLKQRNEVISNNMLELSSNSIRKDKIKEFIKEETKENTYNYKTISAERLKELLERR